MPSKKSTNPPLPGDNSWAVSFLAPPYSIARDQRKPAQRFTQKPEFQLCISLHSFQNTSLRYFLYCILSSRRMEEVYIGNKNSMTDCDTELLGLPGSVLQYIVSFLVQADRLAAATACKTLCSAVDAYSLSALTKICIEHPVEDGFLDRVRASFPASERPIPSRCLLKRAQSLPLYQLNVYGDVIWGLQAVVSEDGNQLAALRYNFARREVQVSIFDPATKALLRKSAPPVQEGRMPHGVFFLGNTLVTYSTNIILVFNGETLEHTYFPDCPIQIHTAVMKDCSSLLFINVQNKLVSFDISTGMSEELVSLTGPLTGRYTRPLGFSQNGRWLVMEHPVQTMDLHNDCKSTSSMEGFKGTPYMSVDVPNTVFMWNPPHFHVFGLDGITGNLSLLRTCQVEMRSSSLLGVSSGCLFVLWLQGHTRERRAAWSVSVYDPLTGALLRDLQVPDGIRGFDRLLTVLSNGKQVNILVCRSEAGRTIVAYLPDKFY